MRTKGRLQQLALVGLLAVDQRQGRLQIALRRMTACQAIGSNPLQAQSIGRSRSVATALGAMIQQHRLDGIREALHRSGRQIADEVVELFERRALLRRGCGLGGFGALLGQLEPRFQESNFRMARIRGASLGKFFFGHLQQAVSQAPFGQVQVIPRATFLDARSLVQVAFLDIAADDGHLGALDVDLAVFEIDVIAVAGGGDRAGD